MKLPSSDRLSSARGVCLIIAIVLVQATGLVDSNAVTVNMQGKFHGSRVTLSCIVANARKSLSVYFYCPLVKNSRPCLEKCKPVCTTPACLPLNDIDCRIDDSSPNLRILTIVVNQEVAANIGPWYCESSGRKSLVFNLAAPPTTTTTTTTTKKPTTTKSTTTTTTTTTTTKKPPVKPKREDSGHIGGFTDVTVVKPDPKPVPPPVPKSKDHYEVKIIKKTEVKSPPRRQKSQFWTELTSPQLVIVVLALLGTSLIVNVAFCIRCILVKKYIDKYRRGVSDTSCLERCLCLPKARLRPGYKEDLYEDISSTPRIIYSPPGSNKSSGADREDSLELVRSRAYSPSSQRSHNPAARVSDIYATVVRGPRRQSAAGRYYSPQPPPVANQRVYDDVPESRSLSDIYARPHKLRPPSAMGASSSSATGSSCSPRHSPDSSGTPSTLALKRVSEHPCEEDEDMDRDQEGELIENCTRNNTRLELSKTLLHRADTLLREAGVLLD